MAKIESGQTSADTAATLCPNPGPRTRTWEAKRTLVAGFARILKATIEIATGDRNKSSTSSKSNGDDNI